MQQLTLPIPPSNNHYKRYYCERSTKLDPHTIGAYLTEQAKQYKSDAGWTAKAAGVRLNSGDLAVRLDVYLGTRDIDADNICKVLLDSLNGIAWADDSQIVDLHIVKHRNCRKRRVEMTIAEIGGHS